MNHEVSRQVSEDEEKLWDEVKRASNEGPTWTVRFVHVGHERLGLHQERVRQIAATWENEGLLTARSRGYNEGMLTEYGMQVDSIESNLTSGESWR